MDAWIGPNVGSFASNHSLMSSDGLQPYSTRYEVSGLRSNYQCINCHLIEAQTNPHAKYKYRLYCNRPQPPFSQNPFHPDGMGLPHSRVMATSGGSL
eukprot:484567-Rhodomonas_salina.1